MGIEIKDVIYRQLAGCLCCAEFTDEQREIQQVARRFAKDEIIPKAAYHDQTGEVADQCTIAIFCLLWLPACKQFNNSQRFTLQDHSSTPSSAAVLTTVMPCYTALQIVSFSDCSLCRTLLRGWSLACGERSTSRRYWSLCTGYRFGNKWHFLTVWCTDVLVAALRSTWQSSVIQTSFQVVRCLCSTHLDNLPDAIRDLSPSFLTFTKLLKSYLFVWLPRRAWFLTGALQVY